MGLALIFLFTITIFIHSLVVRTTQLGPATQTQRKTIVMVGKRNQSDYWQNVRMGAQAAAKELNVNVKYLTPKTEDGQAQIQLIDHSLDKGMNALVLASSDYNAPVKEIEKVNKKQIPIIAIDSEVKSSNIRSYIGTNNDLAGKIAGQKIIDLTGPNSTIGILGSAPNRDEVQLEKGIGELVHQYPGVHIVDTEYCNSDAGRAGVIAGKMISSNQNLDGIVALDVASATGAATEINKLGDAGKMKLITFNSSQEELGLLQDGVIQAIIIQNPYQMGYLGVKYAVDQLEGKTVPKRFELDMKIIDSDNMFWPENEKLLFPFS